MSESFRQRLETKLTTLRSLDLKRTLPGPVDKLGRSCRLNGTEYLNFSSNDYLGLADEFEVKNAAEAVMNQYGAGAGGSRLICGDHPVYAQLERELAEWKQRNSALVFGSGYLTSLGVIRAVTSGRDLIIHDELAHRCLIDGARLSEASVKSYQHNSIRHLRRLLEEARSSYDAVLVLTEGIFSMDGDRAPLQDTVDVCREFDAWLLVDEAHSAGVWGREGAGLTPELDPSPEITMGTLSKTFGSYGGYIAGSERLRNYLINRAGSLIYSTGLPPAVVQASLVALNLIRTDKDRRKRLKQIIRRCQKWFDKRGIPLPQPATQVLPVVTGDVDKTLEAGSILREEGIFAVPIRYPTVPRKQGRIRISLRADHTSADVSRLLESLDRLEREGYFVRTAPWNQDAPD